MSVAPANIGSVSPSATSSQFIASVTGSCRYESTLVVSIRNSLVAMAPLRETFRNARRDSVERYSARRLYSMSITFRSLPSSPGIWISKVRVSLSG